MPQVRRSNPQGKGGKKEGKKRVLSRFEGAEERKARGSFPIIALE